MERTMFGLLLLGPRGQGRTAITLMPSYASAWGEALAHHGGLGRMPSLCDGAETGLV
jgi:hypothetical protein